MKVKFSIKQEVIPGTRGFLSSTSGKILYKLNVSFIPTEREKKIFNDHPLFHNHQFLVLGAYFKNNNDPNDYEPVVITVSDIYYTNSYSFQANSLDGDKGIFELRKKIIDAGNRYAYYISILESLEDEEEIEFKSTK